MEIRLNANVLDVLPESIALGTAAMFDQREKGIVKYHKSIEEANLSVAELAAHAQQEMADGLVYTSMLLKKLAEQEVDVVRMQMALSEIRTMMLNIETPTRFAKKLLAIAEGGLK